MFLSTLQQTGKQGIRPEYATFDHSHVPPAGKVSTASEHVDQCFGSQPDQNRASTPDHVKKYRHPNLMEPGKTITHPGLADDVRNLPTGPYGRATRQPPGESVREYMRTEPESAVERWKRDQAEKNYASHQREPLGQPMVRGHHLPEGMGTERAFGRVVDAKGLVEAGQVQQIFNGFPGEELSDTHKMYVRSHGDYAPGEQRSRGYVFPEGTTTDSRFGMRGVVKPTDDQVKGIFKESDGRIVSKIQADFKLANDDRLGKPRTLGHGDRGLAQNHSFGVPSRRFEEWGVDKLLKGEYGPADQEPDADLGKSLRPGYRNTAPEDKTFGVPSVRTDLPLPKSRGIADNQNYGQEPTTSSLLFPSPWADRGLTDEVMTRPLERAEVADLVAASGVQVDPESFDRVFSAACLPDGRCSVGAFLNMRRAMMLAGTMRG